MKVVFLAGGFGTRLSEETENKPKPLVEVGENPILWHIMKHYEHYGFTEFIVALGYKGEAIKKYFMDYFNYGCDMKIDFARGCVDVHDRALERWSVELIDTGLNTMTGGRIKRLEPWLGNETFMVTYGDGVSDINLQDLLEFQRSEKRIATVTAVRPPARFGGLEFDGNQVSAFTEKPQVGEGWINGGFMVFEPSVFDYIEGDNSSLESNVLEWLAREGQLSAYKHEGFWQCVDTLRDLSYLNKLWNEGSAPWQIW